MAKVHVTDRICVDCRHFLRGRGGQLSLCCRPGGERFSPVDGRYRRPVGRPARSERRYGLMAMLFGLDRCGPEGRYFEKKAAPVPPSTGSAARRHP